VKALNALGITATSSACTTVAATTLTCDANAKSQHLVTLNVQDCPATATLSAASLTALSADLTELSFLNCPLADPLPDPSAAMVTNLASFTVTGPPEVYGWWMGRLTALTTLQVRDTLVNASSLDVITSNLVNLATLTISNASLGGIFPATWPAPTKLTALDLSNNQLYGPIPASIAKMTKLTTLDLSGNNFNDHIVTAIGDMASLTSLDLSHNALRMGIPKKLQNLHYLTKLDLSFNQLNGTIPDELSYLPLTYLDLSNNTLTGAVPFTDLFLSKLKVANFGGNVDLCYNSTITSAKSAAAVGLPLCGASLAPTPGPAYYGPAMAPAGAPLAGASPSTKKKPKVVVIVFATLGALVGLAAVIYFCCRYWGAKAGYQ
jgi:Leucine-rich repeat (LRR) protein